MKKYVFLIVSTACFLLSQKIQAQGTLYLSNIGQPPGSEWLAGGGWLAPSFITGNNPGGYDLNYVQLRTGPASGGASGFSVFLYSSSGGAPGTSLGSLSGPDPLLGGDLNYAATGIHLAPSTQYFIAVTSAQGGYRLSGTYDAAVSSDSWAVGPSWSSGNGTTWSQGRPGLTEQFSVTATPVPEPGTCALVGLGLAALGVSRKKRGTARKEQLQ